MGTPPLIEMANISMGDTLLLMILALVVFGPRRLPQIGRQIGKLMYEFRKASNDFKFQMEEELRTAEEADRRKREEAERQQRLALAAQSQPAETKTEANPADSAPVAATDVPGAAPEDPAAESAPRIMPPNTGETVAATRAGRAMVREAAGEPPPVASSTENETATEESRALTEQASRNG